MEITIPVWLMDKKQSLKPASSDISPHILSEFMVNFSETQRSPCQVSSADKLWITVRQLCTTISKILSSLASWSFNTAGSCMEPETSMTKQRFAGKPEGCFRAPVSHRYFKMYFLHNLYTFPKWMMSKINGKSDSANQRNVVLHRLQWMHGLSPHSPGLDRPSPWVPSHDDSAVTEVAGCAAGSTE
jgi:hypothetical protein